MLLAPRTYYLRKRSVAFGKERTIEGHKCELYEIYGLLTNYRQYLLVDEVRLELKKQYKFVRLITNRNGEKAIYVSEQIDGQDLPTHSIHIQQP